MQIINEIAEGERSLEQCETSYRIGTVFAYRDLVQPALDGEKRALEVAGKVLDQRIAANRSALAKVQGDERQEISVASSRVSDLERQADQRASSYVGRFGCIGSVVIVFGVYFCFMLTAVGDAPLREGGRVALTVMLLVLVVFLLKNPILKFLTATL